MYVNPKLLIYSSLRSCVFTCSFISFLSFYHSRLQCLPLFLCSLFSSFSHVQLFVTPWTATRQASLSITNSLSLLKLMSIESVMPSNHLILCRPLLPSVFPSITVFSSQSVVCIRWPKYWSFSFSISPSNEYSALISFRMDWFDLRDFSIAQMVKSLPAIQGTWVQSLGQEDPLEKEMATHSSILAERIPWTGEPGRLQSMGSQRVRRD